MSYIAITTDFPPEDLEWLKREAAKHNIRIMDVINDLMEIHMPHGFETDRPMSEEEFAQHLTDLVKALVRRIRQSQVQ